MRYPYTIRAGAKQGPCHQDHAPRVHTYIHPRGARRGVNEPSSKGDMDTGSECIVSRECERVCVVYIYILYIQLPLHTRCASYTLSLHYTLNLSVYVHFRGRLQGTPRTPRVWMYGCMDGWKRQVSSAQVVAPQALSTLAPHTAWMYLPCLLTHPTNGDDNAQLVLATQWRTGRHHNPCVYCDTVVH